MRNLHYKGIFSLNGELVQTYYNPHEFDKTTIIVAYQILTHIEEHKTPEVKNITYQVMGSYRPRGDYQGYAIIRLIKQTHLVELVKESRLRVYLSGNPLFWAACRQLQPKLSLTLELNRPTPTQQNQKQSTINN